MKATIITFTNIIEKETFYTLDKENEKRFKDAWFNNSLPTIKKTMWGIEIKKPIGYAVYKAFIGDDGIQYSNDSGWIFEENGSITNIDSKRKAKRYGKV